MPDLGFGRWLESLEVRVHDADEHLQNAARHIENARRIQASMDQKIHQASARMVWLEAGVVEWGRGLASHRRTPKREARPLSNAEAR